MRRKVVKGMLVLVFLVGCTFLVLQLTSRPEPMYDGKPLRYWAKRSRHAQVDDSVRILTQMGAVAVPCLTNQLTFADGPIQKARLWIWSKLPTAITSRLPEPVEASDLRAGAAWVLIQLGPAAKAAVPSLIAALKDNDLFVRLNAAASFGKIGPAAAPAIPALIAALGDRHRGVRFNSAYSLSLLGPLAKEAVPSLKVALNDPDPDVRMNAEEAIQMIDPSSVTLDK